MSEQPKPPPLGLVPRWLRNEHRRQEIEAAIQRYSEAKKRVPHDWVSEWLDLVLPLCEQRPEKVEVISPAEHVASLPEQQQQWLHSLYEDKREPVASPSRGWRHYTESFPDKGDTVLVKTAVGMIYVLTFTDRMHWEEIIKPYWIPLSEVLAAIEAAEVPELERRMDERFPHWELQEPSNGRWQVRYKWREGFFTSEIRNTKAAAMRAALGIEECGPIGPGEET